MTADSYEYENWVSRKPSKKKIQRAALVANPIGTVAQIGTLAGKKAIERAGETAARTALRNVAGAGVLTGAASIVRNIAAPVAILTAGYYVMDHVAKTEGMKLGDRVNAISNRFLETQRQLVKAYGVRDFAQLPADTRARALADYKRALATATAQAQGSALVGVREAGSYK